MAASHALERVLVVGAVIVLWPQLAKLGPLYELTPSTEY